MLQPANGAVVGWIIAMVAGLLVGLSKTGLSGVGILGIALFAAVLPARVSTGAVLPLLVAADIVAVIAYRRHADWSHLVRLFPVTAVGIVLGTLALRSHLLKSNENVKVAIGMAIIAMALYAY